MITEESIQELRDNLQDSMEMWNEQIEGGSQWERIEAESARDAYQYFIDCLNHLLDNSEENAAK